MQKAKNKGGKRGNKKWLQQEHATAMHRRITPEENEKVLGHK
jgi:hypothetical protein